MASNTQSIYGLRPLRMHILRIGNSNGGLGIERGERCREKARTEGTSDRGMLEYSLERSQDQTEEVEVEDTYLKTKINLKSQSHNLQCAA